MASINYSEKLLLQYLLIKRPCTAAVRLSFLLWELSKVSRVVVVLVVDDVPVRFVGLNALRRHKRAELLMAATAK